MSNHSVDEVVETIRCTWCPAGQPAQQKGQELLECNEDEHGHLEPLQGSINAGCKTFYVVLHDKKENMEVLLLDFVTPVGSYYILQLQKHIQLNNIVDT